LQKFLPVEIQINLKGVG